MRQSTSRVSVRRVPGSNRPNGAAAPAEVYKQDYDGIWTSKTDDRPAWSRLTNFRARIVRNIIDELPNGLEVRYFLIQASLADRTARFEVTVAEFQQMRWQLEHLGGGAVIQAGGMNQNARVMAAIQNEPIEECDLRRVRHTGWRKIGDQEIYVHQGLNNCRVPLSGFRIPFPDLPANPTSEISEKVAQGGASEADCRKCRVEELEVCLDGGLEQVSFPPLEASDSLPQLIRDVLAVLESGKLEITGPLFSAVWRSVLGSTDFGLFIYGRSGQFKSELAAIAQQFFGTAFNSRNWLASWSSTANAIEGLLHDFKDGLFCIDDYSPQSASSQARLQAIADQVFRASGNGVGRGRSRSDGRRVPARKPRGFPVATGEDMPTGYSLQSRVLSLYVDEGDIDATKLKVLQNHGRRGTFAKVMGAYTSWLSCRIRKFRDEPNEVADEIRPFAEKVIRNRRQVDIACQLVTGLEHFLTFAVDSVAIQDEERRVLGKSVWQAITDLIRRQEHDLQSIDPIERFRELMRTALIAGQAHFRNRHGNKPDHFETSWGWWLQTHTQHLDADSVPVKCENLVHKGVCVGWIDSQGLYLDVEASLAVARRVASSNPEPFSITARAFKKHMRPHLKSSELKTREVYTVRKVIQRKTREVLHVEEDFIHPFEHDEADFGNLLDV